jgi:LuxR family maltose regulon positive regulatory protein
MPILKTKLHRPPVPADYVPRQRLLNLLDRARNKPLILVSAPAGYGKSTLVSSWMAGLKSPRAWLSLSEADSDLVTFLSGLTAAVRTISPEAFSRTRALLTGMETPPRLTLEDELIKELNRIDDPFILAIDDYGFIKEPQIHELLTRVLVERIPSLRLIIMTRRDPPLPLGSLRAAAGLVEIRQADLKFTSSEARLFLEKTVGQSLGENENSRFLQKTEGWAVGLRLASLALHGREDVDSFLREIGAATGHIQEYLLSQVLSRQPQEMREALLVTSILERFSAPLVTAICGPGIDGEEFIGRLEQSNIFCVPLDDRKVWYRYHHLFRDLLRTTLEKRYAAEEIAIFHRHAGEWCAAEGLIEMALRHLLAAGDPEGAAGVVSSRRHILMNGEEWHRLTRVLEMLPRSVVEKSPELLLAEGWLLIGWPEMAEIMARVETLLQNAPEGSTGLKGLRGELDVMRSLFFYHVTEGERSLDHARRGLESLPWEQASTRGLAVMLQALSQQMNGDLKGAHGTVYEALKEKDLLHTTYHARVLLTLSFLNYIAGDLKGTIEAARQSLDLGKQLGLAETIAHGYYFLGICHYQRNELEEAEQYLKPVTSGPYIVNAHNFAFSAFAMALVHQALGRSGEARREVEAVVKYAVETGNASLLATAKAFQAELALRQGNISEVSLWAETFDAEPFSVAYRFYVPQVTLARWHLANATQGNVRETGAYLKRLEDFFSAIHNRSLGIDVLAMKALSHDLMGEGGEALAVLEKGLDLAEPGGFVRPFLDLGEPMAELLTRFRDERGDSRYLEKALEAFSARVAPVPDLPLSGPDALRDPLTNREMEILNLLTKRLRNKEIGDRLNISPETVRRHTANIYQKLNVHDRRQAVERAVSLRILREN